MGLTLDELDEKEVTETVNGIPVAIEGQILEASQKMTLDYQDDQLVMAGTDSCC